MHSLHKVTDDQYRPTIQSAIAILAQPPSRPPTDFERFPNTLFFGNQRATWIRIPRDILNRPAKFDDSEEADTNNQPGETESLDLPRSIKRIVAAYLRERCPKIEWISSLDGIGPHSLQRTLRQQGTSYSNLVLQARFEAASTMLRNHDRA